MNKIDILCIKKVDIINSNDSIFLFSITERAIKKTAIAKLVLIVLKDFI